MSAPALTGRGKHQRRAGIVVPEPFLRARAWRPASWPDVDVYLPICGEPAEVLRNTWAGVFELVHAYPGVARALVLDDEPSDQAAAMSASFGFSYLRRPNARQYKKAGNLNFAFVRTSAPFLAVFDAGCRPRSDFLAETLPYLGDPAIGIVQTPRFFRCSPAQAPVERAARASLELFNRAQQVSGDRFGSALCVGSNAVYRRSALAPAGGFTLIPHAADSHTGLDARCSGYRLSYLPVPLAAGVRPATLDALAAQQYRWCCRATSLTWTRHLWRAPMPRLALLPYLAGWLGHLVIALRTLMLPLVLIVPLGCLPAAISIRNCIFLVAAILISTIAYPPRHNSGSSPRIWPISLAVGWAQILALWDFGRGRVMSWTPARRAIDTTRRIWFGVTFWNGGLAVLWVALAAWRLAQTDSLGFAVVGVLGLLYLWVVGRVAVSGRRPP